MAENPHEGTRQDPALLKVITPTHLSYLLPGQWPNFTALLIIAKKKSPGRPRLGLVSLFFFSKWRPETSLYHYFFPKIPTGTTTSCSSTDPGIPGAHG